MRPIESKFKVYEEEVNQHQYFNKLVDERSFFEVFPEVVDYEMLEPVRRDIASFSRGNIIDKDGTLMRVFEKDARIYDTDKRHVQWEIEAGEGDIRATIVETDFDEGQRIGEGGLVFELGLDTDWFGPNDIIILEGFKEMPILIRSEPFSGVESWNYEAVILTEDKRDYLEPRDMEIGTKVIQIGSLIGEATIDRGNVYFGEGDTYVRFEVPMTYMGWEMKITNYALLASKNYRLEPKEAIPGSHPHNTLKEDVLWNSLEMKFMNATNKQLDLWLIHGRAAGRFSSRFLDKMTEKPLVTLISKTG